MSQYEGIAKVTLASPIPQLRRSGGVFDAFEGLVFGAVLLPGHEVKVDLNNVEE